MKPPRPSINRDLILEAARPFCADLQLGDTEAIDLAGVYARGVRCGFKLGVELDLKGWNIDALMVEELDGFHHRVTSTHRERCWTWAKEHDIQPPFPIGTVIEQGEITGVSRFSPATYEVRRPEDCETSRLLVAFEDARRPTPTGPTGILIA